VRKIETVFFIGMCIICFLLGIKLSNVKHKEPKAVGILKIVYSVDEKEPYIFLELKSEVGEIAKHKKIVLLTTKVSQK